MPAYLYHKGLYAWQFSSWSPVQFYVHDDFGNLVEVRAPFAGDHNG